MYYPEIIYPCAYVVFKQYECGHSMECAFFDKNKAYEYVWEHNRVERDEDDDNPEKYVGEVWWECVALH